MTAASRDDKVAPRELPGRRPLAWKPVARILSVYRDGVLHCQAELTEAGLRIGRGAENDVVLEDSLKGVSRAHAELSIDERGLVILSDLNSANGTLVDGVPITAIELDSEQPFNVGPYVLAWDRVETVASGPASEAITLGALTEASEAITILPPSAAPQGDHTVPTAPRAVSVWRRPRTVAVLAVVLLAASAAATVFLLRSRASVSEPARAQLDAARALVAEGKPEAAITALDPVLAEYPEHQEARQIRAQAEAAIQARVAAEPAPAPSPEPAAEPEPLQPDPSAAPLAPPSGSPEPAAGQAPAAAQAPVAKRAARPAPAYPLLERRKGESVGSWHDRSRTASEEYARAADAEANQRYDDAIGRFEQLQASVPGYRDVGARLEAAKASQQALARDLLNQGQEHERRGAFAEAQATYERARQVAPAFPGLADRIGAVRVLKTRACQKAYDDGLNYYNAGRLRDAGENLTRALALCDAGSPQHRDSAELMRTMGNR
jgi:pSer/pThr/pTyr-binding forkhead associated (FHA) protein